MTEVRSNAHASMPRDPVVTEQRVSSLAGDRLCIRCAYNLVGQPVLREPHYEMLIVRCPECATVASVQEYPLLGRWANRWAAVAAGLWFLLLMALWVGTGAMIFGFSVGTGEISSDRLSNIMYGAHQQWLNQRLSAATTQPAVNLGAPQSFEEWWDQLDRAAFIAQHGGWAQVIEWEGLFLWIPLGLLSFALGCVWAIMLLNQRLAGRLLWGGFIMAVAAAFSIIPLVDWLGDDADSYWELSRQILAPIFLGLSLAFGAVCLSFGLIVGRPLVRWMLTLLLPPRLRSPLSLFWLADGLKPPTTS